MLWLRVYEHCSTMEGMVTEAVCGARSSRYSQLTWHGADRKWREPRLQARLSIILKTLLQWPTSSN